MSSCLVRAFAVFPDEVPKSFVKFALEQANVAVEQAIDAKEQAIDAKVQAKRANQLELEKVRSTVEALQLRAMVEEVAAVIRIQVDRPLSVQDALKIAEVNPSFVECIQKKWKSTFGTTQSPTDIRNNLQALYNVLSKPAHQYLKEFDNAHPTLSRHEAVRSYLPYLDCLAKTYGVQSFDLLDDWGASASLERSP
jgi:hypothetical protein